jgi:hypothetical protein
MNPKKRFETTTMTAAAKRSIELLARSWQKQFAYQRH